MIRIIVEPKAAKRIQKMYSGIPDLVEKAVQRAAKKAQRDILRPPKTKRKKSDAVS